MRNRLILLGYLALFFILVSSYDLYRENVYAVAIVALCLMFAGLGAWLWSVQPGKDKR
jgi:VanZ family protein